MRNVVFAAFLLWAAGASAGEYDIANGSYVATDTMSAAKHHAESSAASCWSDVFGLEFPKVSSEIVPSVFETELADDFLLPPGDYVITKVRWWCGPYSGPPDLTSFTVSIYKPAGIVPQQSPFVQIEGLTPEGVYVGTDPFGGPTYEWEADVDIPITVTTQPRFWLVVQALHPIPVPQWGMQGSSDAGGARPFFRGEFFGFPQWTPFRNIVDYKYDAAFEIECHADEEGAERFTTATFSGPSPVARARLGVFPHPVLSSATISFSLNEAGPVRLDLYDVTGRLVAILADGVMPAGRRTVSWSLSGTRAAPGIHFLKLSAGREVGTRKVLVID